MSWTFIEECFVSHDITDLLVDGEEEIAAYKTIRDQATFTNKRLIIRDAQGITGKK
ncbi:MAG: PH domain-containing protein [Carnobacterium sp.]|uniref:PH domain-containing protein n=1 Tax=Carnobacterium sp. TaxID=48221 RepID=UPI003C73E372